MMFGSLMVMGVLIILVERFKVRIPLTNPSSDPTSRLYPNNLYRRVVTLRQNSPSLFLLGLFSCAQLLRFVV